LTVPGASDQSTNRTAAIADALRNAIIEQAISPGTRLPEDVIGKQFGVSRTIVRAAIAQLASEGLVDQRPNRSATVIKPSWEDANDTFDLRIAVEDLVVSRLAGTLTQDQLQVLRDHVELEEQARKAGDEPKSIRLAGEFHSLLAEMTDSPILKRYMRELASRCCLILSLFSRPHSSDCAVAEHRELIDLLECNDVESARQAMNHHLSAVVNRALIKPAARKPDSITDILAVYAPAAGDG
jgi:DNA-binding GntR family transcriptional regulator